MPAPFFQGWRTGDLVFVGGQISADAQGRTVGAVTSRRKPVMFLSSSRFAHEELLIKIEAIARVDK